MDFFLEGDFAHQKKVFQESPTLLAVAGVTLPSVDNTERLRALYSSAYPVLAAPGLPQYIASLDAENARMMAEIQGLSAGGGVGRNFDFAGLGSDPNTESSSVLPGPGTVAGRGAVGYLGPGLHGNQSDIDGGAAAAAGQGAGDGGSNPVGRKQGGATGERGVGAGWDSSVLGGVEGGDPLSPRNREYRRKMIEMDAEHKVRDGFGRVAWAGRGRLV